MSGKALIHTPFVDEARQEEAYAFGLWIFLAGEVLFFGALFCGYAIVRSQHTAQFLAGARHTDPVFGTINTVLLLTSSVALTIGERASAIPWRRTARAMIALALALGIGFLVTKGLEYRSDFSKHLFPDASFALAPDASRMFFGFYWTMTGVHAVHLTIGCVLIARLLWMSVKGVLAPHRLSVRLTILYWHFVDMVWLVLYPLLYLGGR
jgi:cytochrome c oxidase subunit 3